MGSSAKPALQIGWRGAIVEVAEQGMYDSDLRLATLMEEEDSSASSSPSPGPSEDSEEDPEEEEESTASTEFSQTSDMEDIVIERPPRPEGYTKKRVRFPADDMLVSEWMRGLAIEQWNLWNINQFLTYNKVSRRSYRHTNRL